MAYSYYSNGPVMSEPISAVTATPSQQLGTRVIYAGEEYVYCYNGGGASITAGYAVIASLGSGYTVTVSSTTNADCIFGFAAHATWATATYGWIMTRGHCTAKMAAAQSAAAGAYVGLADNGLLATLTAGYPGVAKTVSAAASGAAVGVIFRGIG